MPDPILHGDQSIVVCKKNNDKKCHTHIPAENLSSDLDKHDFKVKRATTGGDPLPINVQQAKVLSGGPTGQIVVIRTEPIPEQLRRNGTEEVTVTVDDNGGTADTEVEVVYYDEDGNVGGPGGPKRRESKRKPKTKATLGATAKSSKRSKRPPSKSGQPKAGSKPTKKDQRPKRK